MRPEKMISVVIPAHNEQEYLAGTLEALFEVKECEFECIVVPNGCTDRTDSDEQTELIGSWQTFLKGRTNGDWQKIFRLPGG